MANLKDIVATLAILSAGTLGVTGCEKSDADASNAPDAGGAAEDAAGDAGMPAEGEGSCAGEAGGEGEGSCAGDAPAEGEEAAEGEGDEEAAEGEE